MFDTLYEEWSSLERFQRTRGVLRLMSTVIHELWTGEDASPLIMPGSIPLATSNVNSELTQYLQDSWKAIIDADVDGPNSEPTKIDTEKPLFGQRSLTKRLARTVFFGAAPTIGPGARSKGITAQRVFLGTAIPGDVPGNFHSALVQLQDRATYFYTGSGKYWYDVQPNISRAAKDQAERLHKEDVWADIVRRLRDQDRTRGDFAGVLVCPESNADIPDLDETRLVVLHPKYPHAKGTESSAKSFAHQATEHRGAANRTDRNTLVYLAADESRLAELNHAVRDYVGWGHVLDSAADLDLTENQRNQAIQRRDQADQTASARLLQTYVWGLVPTQPDPAAPFVMREVKIDGQSSALADRASRRLGSDGDLATRQAAALIRREIDKIPQIWQNGHVSLGDLWKLYSQYPYMPRLRDRTVLEEGLTDQSLVWQSDGFALATDYDDTQQRYIGLWRPSDSTRPPAPTDALLIVQPAHATLQENAPPTKGSGTAETPSDGPTIHTGGHGTSPRSPVSPDLPAVTRFYGVKQLSGDKTALDFKQIVDEVLSHLRAIPGSTVTVRLEIEATNPSGYDTTTTRTVTENANTLKFDQHGFEAS